MTLNAIKEWLITRVVNSTAAGTTTINGTHVDMSGYDGVIFLCLMGALTANQVTKLKAQSGALSDDSDMADITGSTTPAAADADSNKMLVVEVRRPQARYVRPVVIRGTANAVIDGVVAIQYAAARPPVTLSSTVSQSALVVF